ncbi:flagellar motor protein MotB [Novosphingobium cyanobacteriorum]|uniref:Flagellar motor protein MotB n=1 Tax=Novosphingobium cyanobacteriorum TaxID=3024215 RepID=A0ABT6CK17_9SPHN|nr:flagellar motor protein MotB [Novosphingobium cyanobacteriorum]MDF8334270.1 flagellar motor protein MotB [Novosphingobium cyanobacteriorum]
MAKPPKGKNEPPPPIIVKKITVVAGGHHGGAWKVAYADFVTAMMAFFLLMWLLGATTEKQRKGIADYFTPTLVKTKEGSAGGYGVLGGSSLTDVDSYPHAAGQTGSKTLTVPRDATGGPKDGGSKVKRTATLQERLKKTLEKSEKLRQLAKQVKLTMTPDGIRLDLMDDANFSMFRLGTTILTPDAMQLMQAIGEAIAPEPGGVTVRGHTDALPWKADAGLNNWSLSAGRAEATRQALMRFGVTDKRFRRIEGVADQEPLISENPSDPRNRRMSILLLD